MWDVFEIKGGTRDQSGQKWQVNMTSARYLLLLYAKWMNFVSVTIMFLNSFPGSLFFPPPGAREGGKKRPWERGCMFLLTRIHHYAKYDWLRQVDGQVIRLTFI